jgi:signal recognition particle receptor subunit beta
MGPVSAGNKQGVSKTSRKIWVRTSLRSKDGALSVVR